MNINMYEHCEGMIIQITGSNLSKTITIGNINMPPRSRNENIKKIDFIYNGK